MNAASEAVEAFISRSKEKLRALKGDQRLLLRQLMLLQVILLLIRQAETTKQRAYRFEFCMTSAAV
jgi:hypothetical protein